MILKFRTFEKYLNILFVFLFPTQLALHFWPQYSFVFGLRVDYLSPTIYLTDALFLILFLPWLVRERKINFSNIGKIKIFIICFLAVLSFNILFSSFSLLSLIKWVKIIEMLALAYYVKNRPEIFSLRNVSLTLFFSSAFFLLIGIVQVIYGKTLGGVFYWFGERTFSVFTPGIAITSYFGKNILRIYSTFPHPNSLAGFVSAIAIFLLFGGHYKINKIFKHLGWTLIVVGLLMSFSLSALIGLAAAALMCYLVDAGFFKKKHWVVFIFLVFVSSFYFSTISKSVLGSGINLHQSYRERFELAELSRKLFSDNWLSGVGLNAFIPSQLNYLGFTSGKWLMQPVHNVYLLVAAESGILGVSLLFFALTKIFKSITKVNKKWGLMLMVFILITSLFDHYWFTLQQNMLLLAFFLGILFRDKN